MTADKFLYFLTHNNTLIIQVLVTAILLISAFVVYRMYVASPAEEEMAGGSSQHLEKTLQKFLESQANTAKPEATSGAALPADVEKLREELLQSRATIKEKEDRIASLEKQVESGVGVANAAPAEAGMSAEEKSKYDSKIQDLEQRLAEYEIIAEDIADLARYREENVKLKEQLQKGGGAPAAPSAATPPAPTPPSAEPVAVASEPTAPAATEVATPAAVEASQEVAAAAPAVAEAASEPVAASNADIESAVAAVAESETPSNVVSGDPVTDDIMAEFEAAVRQQKEETAAAANASPSDPGGEVPGASIPEEDRKKLLDDFENFVKKA